MNELLHSIQAAEDHILALLAESGISGEELERLLAAADRGGFAESDHQTHGSKLWGITTLCLIRGLKDALPQQRALITTEYALEVLSLLPDIFRCGTLYGATTSSRINHDETCRLTHHSLSMRKGNRTPRGTSELDEILTEIASDHLKLHRKFPTMCDAWAALRQRAKGADPHIASVTRDEIRWLDSARLPTARRTVENRLSNLRKKLRNT